MWTDGQMDRLTDTNDEANSRFHQFANAPKNELLELNKYINQMEEVAGRKCFADPLYDLDHPESL